jgi:hypothetical protein
MQVRNLPTPTKKGKKNMIEIKNKTGETIHTYDGADLCDADLCDANLDGADLYGADLRGANLRGANLYGANLYGANLRGANLRGANLYGADLCDADLCDANLRRADLSSADLRAADLYGADLYGADLRYANLRYANLYGADLCGADLGRADLDGANLRSADLGAIRADLRSVLDVSPAEVPGLLAALREGRVNGTAYSGECACLVGTIANVRGCAYDAIPDLRPDASRPAERWFLAIATGDAPETSQVVSITVEWVEDWLAAR